MILKCNGALVDAALAAGIAVPPDIEEYDRQIYCHWNLLCGIQVNHILTKPYVEWHNALVIAGLTKEEVQYATWEMLLARGFQRA